MHSLHPVVGSDYLNLGKNALKQIKDYSDNTGDRIVIHLGDTFQLKDRIPARVWNTFFEELIEWEERGIESYWLMGNHDFKDDISIDAFKVSSQAYPITNTTIIDIDDTKCQFLPYRHNIEKVEGFDILFMHDYFIGKTAIGGKLTVIGEGIKLPENRDWLVFAGHSHRFQKVEKGVWHIGSPYQVNFNEVGEKKYFIHITPDKVKFIRFSFPEFKILEMGDYITSVENAYIKVSYNTSSIVDSDAKEYKKYLLDKGALGVKLNPNYIPNVKQRLKLSRKTQQIDYLKEYIEMTAGELDKNKLYKIGSKLMYLGEEEWQQAEK